MTVENSLYRLRYLDFSWTEWILSYFYSYGLFRFYSLATFPSLTASLPGSVITLQCLSPVETSFLLSIDVFLQPGWRIAFPLLAYFPFLLPSLSFGCSTPDVLSSFPSVSELRIPLISCLRSFWLFKHNWKWKRSLKFSEGCFFLKCADPLIFSLSRFRAIIWKGSMQTPSKNREDVST